MHIVFLHVVEAETRQRAACEYSTAVDADVVAAVVYFSFACDGQSGCVSRYNVHRSAEVFLVVIKADKSEFAYGVFVERLFFFLFIGIAETGVYQNKSFSSRRYNLVGLKILHVIQQPPAFISGQILKAVDSGLCSVHAPHHKVIH